jgi:glycosyltransferase involved in cell wall biosynthesis
MGNDGTVARMHPRTYGLYLGDLNRASNQSHGIINYAVSLAITLSKLVEPGERLVVYANPEIAEELTGFDPRLARIHRVSIPKNYAHRLVLDSQVVWLARRHGVDVLHFPKGILPLGMPRRRPALVATIHDDIAMRYAESEEARRHLPTRVRNTLIARLFMRSLRRADRVITISERSRDALLARLHGRTRDIEVIGIASVLPELDFVPKSERGPHVLHLSSPVPHKHTAFTVGAMTRYLDEHDEDLQLLLIGGIPDGVTADDARIEHRLGPVTNAEMATVMSTARALLFASSMEGYGLPPIEAWAYGTPSIYDSAPSLEEMDRDIPVHLTERTYEVFAEALDTVLALDDAQLLELRDTVMSGSKGKDFGERILRIYRDVVQS